MILGLYPSLDGVFHQGVDGLFAEHVLGGFGIREGEWFVKHKCKIFYRVFSFV
jgi:hypothetical protein